MFKVSLLTLSALALIGAATPSYAQDDDARKMALVKQMHEIRPARTQVREAVEQVSRNLPPMERDRFLKMVENAFDYDRLEKMSV